MRDTRYEIGSALILTVVLTSLLAVIGVMFVMTARVDKMATSAISENRELNFAAETVIAEISQKLVSDVPGLPKGDDYYDYPDPCNAWLASLEPYEKTGNYYWRQISDVTGYFSRSAVEDVNAVIVGENDKITDPNNQIADADGDGVADSKWIELENIISNKGRPIYAAIRVIDNGGMLNVNTAYKFDPNDTDPNLIDGSSQMQTDLLSLAERGSTLNPLDKLDGERYGSEPHNLSDYIENVVWRYNKPNGNYTPFDISDELKLRNRYILNYNLMVSRIEELWENAYDGGPEVPIPTGAYDVNDWFYSTNNSSLDVDDYDYRHISTTYNMDRIIDPTGRKMVNINEADFDDLYGAIKKVDTNEVAVQTALNLIDFRDNDSNIATYSYGGQNYYGFEQPCIYISELVHNFTSGLDPMGNPITYRSYAIELYKPYAGDDDPCNWQLVIDGSPIPVSNWTGGKQFYVMVNEDPCAPLPPIDPNAVTKDPAAIVFGGATEIKLQRYVAEISDYITVDYRVVPLPSGNWLAEDGKAHSFQRDITRHKCIRRLWDNTLIDVDSPTLGRANSYTDIARPEMIQAHPEDTRFTNVGEIGMIFRKGAYTVAVDPILPGDTEDDVRFDLTDPDFQQVFKRLTVFDPTGDGIDNDGDGDGIGLDVDDDELKIAGRININTAPWYVIAQLPWIQYEDSTPFERARAICNYRDNTLNGFTSVGELMLVDEMRSLYSDGKDNLNSDTPKGPDLTDDTAQDDFEERDVIFSRISNLVTVRSDVFTAYILVRIGADGPQKRTIAILDRSNVYSAGDKVRIVALHPVPDPR